MTRSKVRRNASRPAGADASSSRRLVIAHPSPDLYGSDLQLLSAIDGLLGQGWQITVVLPTMGPLTERLAERSAVQVQIYAFPVLRRGLLAPRKLLLLLGLLPLSVVRLARLIRSIGPDAIYVNTLTIPWWIVAAKLTRTPVVVHVREAEDGPPRVVRWLLTAPLLLASSVLTNSKSSQRVLLESVGGLERRLTVVYNGIAGPPDPAPRPKVEPVRLALVARLSPRKGIDVALESLAILRASGRDVVLDVCGTPYTGYEWFEDELRRRASRPDLAGAVTFRGYVNPTWPILAEASVVLVPSKMEPFGNTAVEGQLAGRPVIASAVQGLTEIVDDGQTGLLVPPSDAPALAAAIGRVLDDSELADRLSDGGQRSALLRFSLDRYRLDIHEALLGALG